MNLSSLVNIATSLETALLEIEECRLWDKSLRCKYAEYLVAKKLAQQKHSVEILNERSNTNADIFLPHRGKRVEVKSSCFHKDGWADASFSDGKQVFDKKFDYCVWVLFDKEAAKPKHLLVFTRDEIKEVAQKRNGVGSHITNQFLLLLAPNLNEFEGYAKPFAVEKRLVTHRAQFENRWEKIK